MSFQRRSFLLLCFLLLVFFTYAQRGAKKICGEYHLITLKYNNSENEIYSSLLDIKQTTDRQVTFSGYASCNKYFGSIKLKSRKKISISIEGVSLKACDDMLFEQAYFEALRKSRFYQLNKNHLILFDERKNLMAVFEKKTGS